MGGGPGETSNRYFPACAPVTNASRKGIAVDFASRSREGNRAERSKRRERAWLQRSARLPSRLRPAKSTTTRKGVILKRPTVFSQGSEFRCHSERGEGSLSDTAHVRLNQEGFFASLRMTCKPASDAVNRSFVVVALRATWNYLREVSGESDYARYRARPLDAGAPAMNAEEFYLCQLRRKYSRINRCC